VLRQNAIRTRFFSFGTRERISDIQPFKSAGVRSRSPNSPDSL
jgi:hypothetical protein